MGTFTKLWKESASLLILGKNANGTFVNGFNYKILVMKRSQKTKFMPNSIVFPGGNVEKSDDNVDWLKLYRGLGISEGKFKQITTTASVSRRPFIFERQIEHSLEREISLRITAIRETFEEVGILLCKKKEQFSENSPFTDFVQNINVLQSQKEVHNDSSKFNKLCADLNVAPDLWSLYEWAVWLTPTDMSAQRFEAAFFLTALEEQPDITADKSEVQEFMWIAPSELLKLYRAKQLQLPPPQICELTKLCQFNDIYEIVLHAKERNNNGTTLIFPILYTTTNGIVMVYPGDDYYPEHPDYNSTVHDKDIFAHCTRQEFRKLTKNLHRTEHTSLEPGSMEIYCNIQPLNGRINAVDFVL